MKIQDISVDKISPSPYQPREIFKEEVIQQLAGSIKNHGLISPITVKSIEDGNFQIITGERRWRAVKSLGLKTIQAIVKDLNPSEHRIESLIENVHRMDLTMVEKGRAVYDIFLSKGFTIKSKNLANEINNARKKKSRKIPPNGTQKQILKICREIEINPRTICTWLNVISADPYIIEIEMKKSVEERIAETILARLSVVENKELQRKIYAKVVKDDMGKSKASKFITQIKKLESKDPNLAEAFLTTELPIDIIDTPMGYSIDISREQMEELDRIIIESQRKSDEILSQPIVQERGRHLKNWTSHTHIQSFEHTLFCPYCGSPAHKNLRWICHPNKSIEESVNQSGENLDDAQNRDTPNLLFLESKKKKKVKN